MKKFFLLASLACLIFSCQSQQANEQKGYVQEGVEEVGTYTVSVIEPNIYHLQDYNSTYPIGLIKNDSGQVVGNNNPSDMYLLVGQESALLIDLSNEIKWADNGVESLQKVVADRVGNLPLTVTCTHNHGDHIGMAAAFVQNPEVKFVMPKVDFENLPDLFPASQLTLFDEGYQFDLGGLKVNTLMTPGHTPGSMLFFVEGKDMCFSGDAIGSGTGVWIFNLDGFVQYAQSVPKLMDYINNPANGINKEKLVFWGGHYHQREGMDLKEGEGMGYTYLEETAELIQKIKEGTAEFTPVDFFHVLTASYKHKNAGIVWNDSLANIYRGME